MLRSFASLNTFIATVPVPFTSVLEELNNCTPVHVEVITAPSLAPEVRRPPCPDPSVGTANPDVSETLNPSTLVPEVASQNVPKSSPVPLATEFTVESAICACVLSAK